MVSRLSNILLRELKGLILYKNWRQYNLPMLEFKREILKSKDYAPVFFLSTGRTGTKFFTRLLNKSKKVKAFHNPAPEMIEQGKVIYEYYYENGLNVNNHIISHIFSAGREDILHKTYLHNKIYIETNNRITFLAPAIKYYIPNARFIHLYRHPGEFIRSGMRRKWYTKAGGEHELGRIVPTSGNPFFHRWQSFTNVEKIAWLWMETNTFIDRFLSLSDEKRFMRFNFNSLTVSNIKKLFGFIGLNDISQQYIEKNIKIPVNIQTANSFPIYNNWASEMKDRVKAICGDLAQKYGYEL